MLLDRGGARAAVPVGVQDHYGAPVRPFVWAQQLVRGAVHARILRRRDDDILGRVKAELSAAQAAVELIAAEEAPQYLLHATVGEEEDDVALAR